MDSVDRILAIKEKNKEEREMQLLERFQKNQSGTSIAIAQCNCAVMVSDLEESDGDDNYQEVEDPSFEHIEKTKKTSTVDIKLPARSGLIEKISVVADRFRLSDRQVVALTTSTVKACGVINQLSLSVATAN